MSRNTQHQFVSTDVEEVVSAVTAMYEAILHTTVRPADPEMLFIRWVSSVIVQERALTNYTGNQNVPSRAEGENLDALAELTKIQARPEAKPSACTMRFTISEPQERVILIPAGTRVTDRNALLVWETGEDHYIPAGSSYLDVPVRCQTAGTVGNGYAIGQIDTIVDVFDYYLKCENLTATDGGSDVPTDDEYYELMRASMDAFSCAGARGGYIYFAKQVSTEIADVVANSPEPGVVKLYVLMDGGTPAGEEVKRKVLEACSADEVRPLTDLVSVEDPETVDYDVDVTYYIRSDSTKSGTAIAAAVQRAVEEYTTWQSARLGRDINPSHLIRLLMETGVKRVEVASPVFTKLRGGRLTLTADMSYQEEDAGPQVAKVGKVTVTNGGDEDE